MFGWFKKKDKEPSWDEINERRINWRQEQTDKILDPLEEELKKIDEAIKLEDFNKCDWTEIDKKFLDTCNDFKNMNQYERNRFLNGNFDVEEAEKIYPRVNDGVNIQDEINRLEDDKEI